MSEMNSNRHAGEEDERYCRNRSLWSGETLCLKKYPTGDEKAGFMGYSAYGVLLSTQEPVTIYLRGDTPASDFIRTKTYPSIDLMLGDGWVVD